MQIIPEPERPVRLQPAGAAQSIDITSIRSISSSTEIAPDNPSPFTIICPDLTRIDVLPGQTFACPQPAVLMAAGQVTPTPTPFPLPPPRTAKLDPQRGKELIDLTPDEKNALNQARKKIETLHLAELPTLFLLASLYATYELYDDAVTFLEEEPNRVADSAILRLLGTLHLRNMAPDLAYEPFMQALQIAQNRDDKEGQAVARYYLAMTFDAQGQYDAVFTQHAREALKLCRELGYTEMIHTIEDVLQHAR